MSNDIYFPTRNDTKGFALRTLKNLDYIETGQREGHDVHVVTQLALSLLGLIVYPHEDDEYRVLEGHAFENNGPDGRAIWHFTKGKSRTLSDHLRHLRNAIAHRHVHFSSDNRFLHGVRIRFSDCKKVRQTKETIVHWEAEIGADHLAIYCRQFINRLLEL